MKNMMIVLTFLLLIFGFLGCSLNKQNKQNDLESIRKAVIGKDYSFVRGHLGEPSTLISRGYCAPSLGATPEEAKEHYRKTVAAIWEYDMFSVTFNAEGVAISVDPK